MLFGVIPPTAQDYNYNAYTQYSQKIYFQRKVMTVRTVLFPILTQIECLDVDVASGRLQIWDILGGENQKFIFRTCWI